MTSVGANKFAPTGRPLRYPRPTMQLPADFRPADILHFHARDKQQRAERVTADGFEKGLMWHGHPACLTVVLGPDSATASLAVDGPAPDTAEVDTRVRHMLGLDQPVAAFAAAHRDDPELGPLLARRPGLRVPQTASPFEALSWAITGQQISMAAALAVRRRLIDTAGRRHGGGLACYPDAADVARLDETALRGAGLSTTKAQTLLNVARLVVDGHLPLDDWLTAPADEIRARLATLRGIGPWTINYTLLRGFASMDGSLHGDAAVRHQLQALLGRADRIGANEAQTWLARFAPWRALAAAHLWAAQTP